MSLVHYEVGIVGHPARAADHPVLEELTGGQVYSDTERIGCYRNHMRTLAALRDRLSIHNAPEVEYWAVVLEDDCVPVEHFKYQLALALSAAPTRVVSLYLGTGHPTHWQPKIKTAVEAAHNRDQAWIVSEHLLHAVGYAVRADTLHELLDGMPADDKRAIDARITMWLRQNRVLVGYCQPSLVDHLDEQSVIGLHPDGLARNRPRHAWSVGTRDHYRSKAVLL